jgi:hypothetical protein
MMQYYAGLREIRNFIPPYSFVATTMIATVLARICATDLHRNDPHPAARER